MRVLMFDILYSELCGWGWIMYEEIGKDNEGFGIYKIRGGESGINWTKDIAEKRCEAYTKYITEGKM